MIALEGNKRLLYQWELNKRVIVDSAIPGTKVEFSRKYDCKESALPTVAYAEGDHIYANIPNILLQSPGYIRVMVRPSAADTEHMPEVADFKIARREKPEDYAYTETPTETLDNKVNVYWGEENKGKALVIGDDGRVQAQEQPEAGGEVDPEAIKDAVEKYLTENPPAGGGDGWTKLGDVTLTGITLPITAVADGVLTIDITNGEPITSGNYATVLRKPDFSAYIFGRLVKTDVAGQYTLKNMDRVAITPDETYLDYVVEVPDANKLEIAIDGDFEYFKTRITAPAILWHGARRAFSSNIPYFDLPLNPHKKSNSAGEYIVEMKECHIDGYMYVSKTLSIGSLDNAARFDEFVIAKETDIPDSAYIQHHNVLLTIGTRFELWGKK